MADKVTSELYLNLSLGFVDEDTRTIKVPNARSTYSASDFTSLETKFKPTIEGTVTPIFIGDRNGAEYAGILYADRVASDKTDFDLSN